MGRGVRIQPKAGGRSNGLAAAAEPDHNRRAVLQQRDCHRRLVWPDASGTPSGEDSVESYFEQRVALAAFAEVPESALDDVPLTWVTTPAREMGQSLAECILRRLEKGQMSARNQIMPPRLVTRK